MDKLKIFIRKTFIIIYKQKQIMLQKIKNDRLYINISLNSEILTNLQDLNQFLSLWTFQ